MKKIFTTIFFIFLISFFASVESLTPSEYKKESLLSGQIIGTYFGGESVDAITDIIFAGGYIYIVGNTNSNNFIADASAFQPTKSTGYDAFIAKFDMNGNKVWSTYYGGNEDDFATCLKFDDSNNTIIIAGYTASNNLIRFDEPVQNIFGGGTYDAFVACFDINGSFAWDTYLGGLGDDRASSIALYGNNVLIAGKTSSINLPVKDFVQGIIGGGYDGFIGELEGEDGKLEWMTFYGGTGDDEITGIIANETGNPEEIFACGITSSSGGIAFNAQHQSTFGGGTSDAFLLKLEEKEKLDWATYFGGTGDDYFSGIETDGTDFYLTGKSNSTSNISSSGAYQTALAGKDDALLAKFETTGNLVYSTYFGGPEYDSFEDLTIGQDNNIYISGTTLSEKGIYLDKISTRTLKSKTDALWVKFDANGQPSYSNYIGGSNNDEGLCILTDNNNEPIIAGRTSSPDNIASTGAYQTDLKGSEDGFLSTDRPKVEVQITNASNNICIGNQIDIEFTLNYPQIPGVDYEIQLSDITGDFSNPRIIGTGTIENNRTVQIEITEDIIPSDKYRIRINLPVLNILSKDNGSDISIYAPPQPTISGTNALCVGGGIFEYQSNIISGATYNWTVNGGNILSGQGTETISIEWTQAGIDSIFVEASFIDCSGYDTLAVDVKDIPDVTLSAFADVCANDEAFALSGGTPEGGDYLINGIEFIDFNPADFGAGTYVIEYLYTSPEGCTDSAFQNIIVRDIPVKPEIRFENDTLFSSEQTGNQWYYNGVAISGAVLQSYYPFVEGKYSLIVTNQFGCVSEMSDEIIITLGIGPKIQTTDKINFTDITCNEKDSIRIGITNFGDEDLVIDSINISGNNFGDFYFYENYTQLTISPSETDSIGIYFEPTIKGSKSAQMEIFSNAVNEPNKIIELIGNKHIVDFEFSDTLLVLDSIKTDSVFTIQIDLNNTGTTPTQIEILDEPEFFEVISLTPKNLNLNNPAELRLNFIGFNTDTILFDKLSIRENKCGIIKEIRFQLNIYKDMPEDTIPNVEDDIDTVSISIGSAVAVAGDTVIIPITIDGTKKIENSALLEITAKLRFNGTMLDPLKGQSAITDYQLIRDVDIRYLGLRFNVPDNIQTTELKFIANLGSDSITSLELVDIEPQNVNANYNMNSGMFTMLGICKEGGSRLVTFADKFKFNISPNPISDRIKFDCNLIENGYTKIIISNYMGEVVKTILDEDVKLGKFEREIPLDDIGSGLYFITLQTPTILKTAKFRVIK